MQKERLNVKIPSWLGERLDMQAYKEGATKADTVTDILREYYRQQEREGITYGKS